MERFVIIRSNMSGVWFGRLLEETAQTRVLDRARKIYDWEGALSTSDLACSGPTGGRILRPVKLTLDRAPGDECIDCSEEAVRVFQALPEAK